MTRAAVRLFLAFLAVGAGCAAADPSPQRCRDIPANGCPVDQNEACADPTCAATYSCSTDGTWTLEATCPGFHPVDGGTADVAPPPLDAGPMRDVTGIDVPPGASGGPGCVAEQPPDCALSVALACPAGSTDPCCGCDQLFVCDNGGWSAWGYCDPDGGGLVQTP